MKQYLLGLDVGTTGTKTILFTTDGQIVGQAYRSYPTHTPKVQFSEQDPQDWWDAVCQTIREVCAEEEVAKNVAAISMSTQGGTMLAVDKDMNPLRPAIVWNDGRCTREYQEFIEETQDPDMLYRKTGWRAGPGAPVLQPRWMKYNEPEVFENMAMYLSVPDYISYKMTGILAADISNVGINRFADITRAEYDQELLDFAGMKKEQFPTIMPSSQLIGHLTEEGAKALGLTTDTVLVSGAHDQYAVALGAGACKAGDILIGSGTCWVVTCIGDGPDFESGLAQSVAAVPGKWGTLWSLSSGGVCLEWWRKNLTVDADGSLVPFSVINEEVAKRQAAHDGLFFYPFSGCSDLNKSFHKASFVGLDLAHDRFHIARAIMEGVAFQIVWMLDAFRTKPSQEGLKLAGGASKSELWCQMVADIANLPVRIPETADLACVGAAVMAGVGSGVYADAEDGYKRLAIPERVIYPDPQRAKEYAALLEEYKHHAKILGQVYGL